MRKVVIAALIFLAVGCDGGPTRPTVPIDVPTAPIDVPTRISGQVLDSATGAGIPNTSVAFGVGAAAVTPVTDTAVTDTTGVYSVVVPSLGTFSGIVNGRSAGRVFVTGPAYRGDFLVYPSLCIARYGTVSDVRTRRPIAGASVAAAGRSVVTEVDGWYRADLGCPTAGLIVGGTGQGSIRVSHPQYGELVVNATARSIQGVFRHDFELQLR